jgi:hypothetical protein
VQASDSLPPLIATKVLFCLHKIFFVIPWPCNRIYAEDCLELSSNSRLTEKERAFSIHLTLSTQPLFPFLPSVTFPLLALHPFLLPHSLQSPRSQFDIHEVKRGIKLNQDGKPERPNLLFRRSSHQVFIYLWKGL